MGEAQGHWPPGQMKMGTRSLPIAGLAGLETQSDKRSQTCIFKASAYVSSVPEHPWSSLADPSSVNSGVSSLAALGNPLSGMCAKTQFNKHTLKSAVGQGPGGGTRIQAVGSLDVLGMGWRRRSKAVQDGWDKFPWLVDLSWDHSFDPLLRGFGGLERTMTAARGVPAGWRQDAHAHYHPAKQEVLGHSGEGVLASTRETRGNSMGAWSCCQGRPHSA